jgi:hypothetical protein
MPTLKVDSLLFSFDRSVDAQRYDTWSHYLNMWNKHGGEKAVDVVAVGGNAAANAMWLIEAKDFRVISNPPNPSNIGGLAQTVADKVKDTLAGLSHAQTHAVKASEKTHAAAALAAPIRRVVLHLEPHTGTHTKLFPKGFSASVLQKLKQLVKVTDPNPLVLNIASTPMAGVPWTVA